MNDKPPSDDELKLEEQLQHVCKRAIALLNAESGRGLLDGSYETERICLDVPVAYTYLAAYLSLIEPHPGKPAGKFWEEHFLQYPKTDGKGLRKLMRQTLLSIIERQMQHHLLMLLHRQHPFCRKPSPLEHEDGPVH